MVRGINLRYLGFIVGLVVLYFVLLYFMPRKFSWTVSFYHNDKEPFGAYVLKTLVDDVGTELLETSNQTLYEIRYLETQNLLVICNYFNITDAEKETLFELAASGKNILVAANNIDTLVTNEIGVEMNQPDFRVMVENMWGKDSIGIRFTSNDPEKTYWLPRQLLTQYFTGYDDSNSDVLAENIDGKAVFIKCRYGNGYIFLCSTPMVFTNFSMLKNDNYEFVSGMLSNFMQDQTLWTSYYQLGRMEAQSPLRYLLSEPSLKWAFYLTLISIIIFMFFEARRRQRVIPVIEPLKNDTLDFVKTISRLYYLKKDHKQLATKMTLHFMDHLKQKWLIDVNDDIREVIAKVSAKTGRDRTEVQNLFEQMDKVSRAKYISSEELKIYAKRIDEVLNKNYSK
jgi:hypothetical protein